MAHGGTYEETVSNVQEAIKLWVDASTEFGDPVPEPKGGRLILRDLTNDAPGFEIAGGMI